MNILTAEETVQRAYCVMVNIPQIMLVYKTSAESDEAAKVLHEIFKGGSLHILFNYNEIAADILVFDTDSGRMLKVDGIKFYDQNTAAWLQRQPKEINSVGLYTGWQKTANGFGMSYFPELESESIRKVHKLTLSFIK